VYRWYLDPLAKKRGIPIAELRGPKRGDAELMSSLGSAEGSVLEK